jgi:hypothetical protein
MTRKHSLIDYPFLVLSWIAGAFIYYPSMFFIRLVYFLGQKRSTSTELHEEVHVEPTPFADVIEAELGNATERERLIQLARDSGVTVYTVDYSDEDWAAKTAKFISDSLYNKEE